MPLSDLSSADQSLLNILQKRIPFAERPFQEMGEEVGYSEEETLSRVAVFKDMKIVRQISAIFDTRSLNYESSLVAVKISKDHLEEGAAFISTHPNVSHNYRRDHEFNLWYTVAVSPDSLLGLEKTVEVLHRHSGAEVSRLMPTLRLYKIGVQLDMTEKHDIAAKGKVAYSQKDRREHPPLNEREKAFVRALQDDMPLVARPYRAMADASDASETELLDAAKHFKENGQMRRFAAVLHHRAAGFRVNVMGVWAVPEERVDKIGEDMAAFRAISHCYRRPTYPDWPYNVFTMIHARDKEECQTALRTISEETGMRDYTGLYTTKEYKKTRVRYFTPEERDWEEAYVSEFQSPT